MAALQIWSENSARRLADVKKSPSAYADGMDEDLLSLAQGLGYEHRHRTKVDVFKHPGSPFTLGLETSAEGTILPYIYVRTSSWAWPGERTDLNDILSTLVAVSLRSSATSCRFVEVNNEFSRIAGELYGRYLVPEQPFATGYPSGNDSSDELQRLIASIFWAEQSAGLILQACGASDDSEGMCGDVDDPGLVEWVRLIEKTLGRRDVEATYNSRADPSWWYYRTSAGTAVVRSGDLAAGITSLSRPSDDDFSQTMRTQHGLIIRDRGVRSYIPTALQRKVLRILRELGELKDGEPAIVALENQAIAASGSHTIFIQSSTGRREYDRQTRALRRKLTAEASFLYADVPLVWKDHVPGDRFQLLVADLLRREPGVSRVRPVGAATESDGGRDYLIDWVTPLLPDESAIEDVPPSRLRRVAVQAKSNKMPVSRSDITGVYDTMRHYRVDGYLLVVRSRLTVPLVDLLDDIRTTHGLFAEWWEEWDVEDRIRKNPDLLERYKDIVRPQ